MLLRKMSVSGYIFVSGFNSGKLPFCGLACSVGLGDFGIVFMDRKFLTNPVISEELKDFILAHEIAHIVRRHVLSRIIIKFLTEISIKTLSESIKSLKEVKNVIDGIYKLIMTVFLFGKTLKLTVEIEPQAVKQEELEADDIAIKLTGC